MRELLGVDFSHLFTNRLLLLLAAALHQDLSSSLAVSSKRVFGLGPLDGWSVGWLHFEIAGHDNPLYLYASCREAANSQTEGERGPTSNEQIDDGKKADTLRLGWSSRKVAIISNWHTEANKLPVMI